MTPDPDEGASPPDSFESALEAIGDLVLLLDEAGRVAWANRAARERFGPEATPGRPLAEWLGVGLTRALRDLVEAGGGRLEEPVHLPDLRGVFSVAAWPRRERGAGTPVLVLQDIGEQVLLREQLLHTEKLSALGELISGIAHELNNPLTAVLGYAQLLEMKGDGRFAEELSRLREESLRASRIVKNLLGFARRTVPHREPTDLNDVVRQMVALRAYDLRVHNIRIDLSLAEELPHSMMDRGQIQQVVLNLLNNAEASIRATGTSGRIEIATRAEGDRLLLRITDDGPGVPEEMREQIFQPFVTTKPPGEGTGLGLPISFGLVRDHGGEIRLDPTVSPGASFVVELPVVPWQP